MSKLSNIDSAAEKKGSGLVTLWQFVKFIFVSLIAMIVQFVLLNTLKFLPFIAKLYTTEGDPDFHWFVFTVTAAVGGLGYFIVNNTANIAAQIVSFFVNRDKTFNSDANIAITLPIYIVFTVALICFSAWLNPVISSFCMTKFGLGYDAAVNIATMCCSAIQFFLYFPVDKLLFPKKKDTKVEEVKE